MPPGHGIMLTSSLKAGDSAVEIACMCSTTYRAMALSTFPWLAVPRLKSSRCCLGGGGVASDDALFLTQHFYMAEYGTIFT